MEATNMLCKKGRVLICGLAYVLLIGQSFSVVCGKELQLPKDIKVREYFSFFGSRGIDWRALHDPNNNPILVACLKGGTDESLNALGIADLQQRLGRLERGNLISKTDECYTLAFPAVVGKKRDQLQQYAEPISRRLIPVAEKMIADIRRHLTGRDEMVYHVLWSDIMDGRLAWNTAKAEMTKQIQSGDTSIDNKAWLLYPPHPFRAGTNSYSRGFGHLRITWSHNTPSPNTIYRVISQYAGQLTQAIKQNSPVASADAKNALSEYGLVDRAGRVRLYVIQSNSDAAAVYMKLGTEFGRQMMTYLDVTKVGEMLGVSPGIAFVIAYHEICWQLLQDLAEKKVLTVPRIVASAGTEASEAYQLVSLAIIQRTKYPFLETEISEEEKATIKRFNEIKKGILAGEKYFNLSTPVDGLLSYMSAGLSKDADTYRKTCAVKISGSIEFGQNWINQYKYMCIYRVQAWSRNPADGDVHPIYVMAEGEKEFSDVEVFIYHQGGWRKLFNVGNPRTDWRKAVDWGKSLVK